MSYELSLLLNYFVVFIEVLAFMVFSGAFFQKKITSSKFILSTVVLTGLNFICLAISESNVLFKLVLLTCVDSLWLVVIYRVPSIKCIAISVLFSSFINIADNFFFMAITILKNITMQELYRDPYGYYLICYIAKIFEILLFTIFKSAVKQRFYFHHTTWKHWLKIFVLPIVSMFISVKAAHRGCFCLHKKGGKPLKSLNIHRGEIYFADLDPHSGSEQGGKRPVIVLQNNTGNKFSPTVIVAAVSSKVSKKPNQPTHVLVDKNPAFRCPSIVLLEQISTIDKKRICNFMGMTTDQEMQQIENALKCSLALEQECPPHAIQEGSTVARKNSASV